MAATLRCGRLTAIRPSALPRLLGLVLACSGVHAAEPAARFDVSGSGTLSLDPPAQPEDPLQLNASLSPIAAPPATQSTARFLLTAMLSSTSLVCYFDTIFRDDFDADGL